MTNETKPASALPDDDVISLSEIFGIIMDGKSLIVGSTTLFAFCALLYLWVATPVYRADALVQVEGKKSPLGGLVEVSEALTGDTPSEAEIEVLRSRFVLGDVVRSEKLNIVATPDDFPVFGKAVARRYRPEADAALTINSPVPGFSSYAWGGERIEVERFQVPEGMLGETYTLIAGHDGQYELFFEDQLILTGEAGASATSAKHNIRLFISELKARPGTYFNLTHLPMVTAIKHLTQRLGVSEKGKKTGVLSLSLTGPDKKDNARVLEAIAQRYLRQNVERVSAEAQNSLDFLEDQLPKVKADVELSESKLNRYRLQNQTVDLTLETKAVLEQAVDIDTQLAQLDIQIQQMGQRYTASHPVIKELQDQKTFLLNRKKKFLEQTEGLPKTQQDVLRLARDVEVNTLVYTGLLNKAQELKVVKASAVGNVRILDHALSALEPIKPKKALIAVLATLLGAMLGAGLVFLRDMLNQGVKTPEEIEAKTGLPVYATVPESEQLHLLERNAEKQGGHYLLAKAAPNDLSIESLRSLRTNLAFAQMEAPNNRIMITGPAPALGKSFISTNMAALLAESGQRVLLINADMRKGHLYKVFGLKRTAGLSEMLVGTVGKECMVTINERLDLLPCGHYPPNPAELLMSPAFTQLMDKVSQDYDTVLIDTPPILAVTDPAIIGKLCGTSFMVVRSDKTPAREIAYAHRRFEQAGVKVNGCILNGMPQAASRYGNYSYQYAYS
ncbi:polysaccharide biosynthesis tyrosine autokinase [Endozoicomonas sp.]|nr:polysaccharide biosynthesis tyrosine autokinase [Endozoicomonas sp.]